MLEVHECQALFKTRLSVSFEIYFHIGKFYIFIGGGFFLKQYC